MADASEIIKKNAHWEVNVEVDLFHANSGANNLVGGLFKGKTLVYSDLNHIVLRIMPKYASEAEEHAILVSSHIDTVFAAYVCNMLWIYIMICGRSQVMLNILFSGFLLVYSFIFQSRAILHLNLLRKTYYCAI